MSTHTEVRTAVVFVHGLLERRPMDTFDDFTKTVLPRCEGRWAYHAQPLEVTDSYEARRYVAPSVGADLFEYDWSFLMTSTRYAGFGPALARVFLRRPRHVPDQLFGVWRLAWTMVLVPLALLVGLLLIGGYFLHTGVAGWIVGVVTSVVVLSVGLAVLRAAPRALARSFLTTGFVNVARYFDSSPEAQAARHAIRGGLVDLLYTLHQGRYARVVVVGHGIGGYIAYDALTSLWAETHELHAASEETSAPFLRSLSRVEEAADRLAAQPEAAGAAADFRAIQLALWQDLRAQGNPWRVTDFVTVGTPMVFADLFVARPPVLGGLSRLDGGRRELFDRLYRRGVVVRCPPRSEALPVDAVGHGPASYGSGERGGPTVLGGQSPFAVTRWTNIWFPVSRGSIRGDWFGGELRSLFGPGIREIPVSGNRPERLRPGAAQTQYFKHPDRDAEGDVAFHLREVLALHDHGSLGVSLTAPGPDAATIGRVVHRSWQRSM
ncbi:hypothetical protein [Mycolicibacterium austroafricanum]|uniref:hypothetical protein n=1 Tax=Mycolicibacterium austroafricanum TaxID=39687 RepID=UPI001CA30E32|nr:hypothetical protein [Mycolicibacterium austroafricanum]QZT61168.1 hypothetical protein JN085_19530 [Mycolicibacterium austroafricanum]